MTQEEKQLLIQDLCARLPYGVKCINVNWPKDGYVHVYNIRVKEQKIQIFEDWVDIEYCKPYLRPMSNMNEKEKREYASFIGGQKPFDSDFSAYPKEHRFVYEWDVANYVKWLNSRHFDFRGLIPMGLAIEAPKGMYEK